MTLVNSNRNLEVFNFEGNNIRTLVDEHERVLYAAKDVALALGYTNANDAVKRHCKGVVERYPLQTPGGIQEIRFLHEPDVYRLAGHSTLPSAEKFEAWVYEEVLPQINHTGGYIPQAESDVETMARAVLIAQKTIELKDSLIAEQQAKLEAQAPKVVWANAVSASKHSVQVGTLARILRQNGIDTGRDRMFEYLRSHGYLIKTKGMEWNAPTQRSLELGLFTRKQRTIVNPDESTKCVFTTLVTPKGQEYFINKFLGESQQLTLEFEEVE